MHRWNGLVCAKNHQLYHSIEYKWVHVWVTTSVRFSIRWFPRKERKFIGYTQKYGSARVFPSIHPSFTECSAHRTATKYTCVLEQNVFENKFFFVICFFSFVSSHTHTTRFTLRFGTHVRDTPNSDRPRQNGRCRVQPWMCWHFYILLLFVYQCIYYKWNTVAAAVVMCVCVCVDGANCRLI